MMESKCYLTFSYDFYLIVIGEIVAVTPTIPDTWWITPINPKIFNVTKKIVLEFSSLLLICEVKLVLNVCRAPFKVGKRQMSKCLTLFYKPLEMGLRVIMQYFSSIC